MDSPTNCLTHAVDAFRTALAASSRFQAMVDADSAEGAALKIFGKRLNNPANGVAFTEDELMGMLAYGMVYPPGESLYGKRRVYNQRMFPHGVMIVRMARLVPAFDRNDVDVITDDIDRVWQNLWGDVCDQIVAWSLENTCPLIMAFQALDETVTEEDRVEGQGFWQGVEVAFTYDEAGGGA